LAGISFGTVFSKITEGMIANQMGLSLEQFREVYRKFYVVSPSGGIQLFLDRHRL
jgi:hypothetical protein